MNLASARGHETVSLVRAPPPPGPPPASSPVTSQPAVQAFRILAAEQDMDVLEPLAEGINMVFDCFGRPERVEITSGRRNQTCR